MRILLLSVGRPRDRELGGLHERYAERIRSLGVAYEAGWVPEVKPGGRYSDDHVREREARSLLEALRGRGRKVALDRAGEVFSSEAFAARLEAWATPGAAFVGGGHLGLHESVLRAPGASLLWLWASCCRTKKLSSSQPTDSPYRRTLSRVCSNAWFALFHARWPG